LIRLGKLRWKNLLSTGNTFTEVDLGSPGTTLVVGANGGGKSTLTDALSFALYGKPFRRVSKTQLVNSINKKDLLVECEFTVGGSSYLVRRGMKPTVFEVVVDGAALDKDGSIADQQDHLERHVLRINHRAFMQVVVLGSASYVPFMELTAQHRREVLEDILDMRVLGVMSDLLKPRLAELSQELKDSENEANLVAQRLDMRRKFDVAVQVDVAYKKSQAEARAREVESRVKETAGAGVTLAESIKVLEGEISDAAAIRVQDLGRRHGEVMSRLMDVANRIKFFESNHTCPRCEQTVGTDHRDRIRTELEAQSKLLREEADAILGELSVEKERADRNSKLRGELSNLRSEMAALKANLTALRREHEAALRSIEEVSVSAPVINLEEASVIEAELEEINARRAALYERRKMYGAVAGLLKDDGAKAKIISKYVPMINDLINGFLSDLDFFVEFELDSEFNEKIRSRYRDEFTYNSFSEGEKMRINLAILFTWRAVARIKNSASTNVVVMDEIFDSSLDPSGAEELMRLLTRLTGDSSVFIISHRTDQMSDKFDRVIRFEKVGNFSVRSD
jgi:DNA repair exonuclease SbcCD ATPase subunit